MRAKLTVIGLALAAACSLTPPARANRDGFNDVVKAIEQFYHVKHQNIPVLARAGVNAMRTVAKIKGGELGRIAEVGTIRVVFFEDQHFDSRGQIASFKTSVQNALGDEWSPLVQTLAPRDEEQTHVFIRENAQKFHVLVIEIERNEATVVQATLKPEALAQLLKDPNEMGKAITDEATISDP
jgi:hypothetical protein